MRQRERARLDNARTASPNSATVDVRYSTTQLQNTIDVVRENGARKTELHATAVTQRGGRGATFRLLTWRSTSAKRELTLFDDIVDNSPLTLSGVNVRGIHLRQGPLEVHAGYASTPVFGSLFAPVSAYADREKQAPTLELIFRDLPELALALDQLGITATSPHEIARLLRENSALINLGFIEGATVNLTPTRTQALLDRNRAGRV